MHDGDPGRARNARRRRLGRGGSEVVTDPGARLPAFHQFLDALVARALNASIGRWEAFWDPNSYSAVALASPADIIDKASYGLADLKGPLPDRATLKLTAPPGFESVEAFREQVAVVHHRAESTSAGASRLSSPPSPGRRRGTDALPILRGVLGRGRRRGGRSVRCPAHVRTLPRHPAAEPDPGQLPLARRQEVVERTDAASVPALSWSMASLAARRAAPSAPSRVLPSPAIRSSIRSGARSAKKATAPPAPSRATSPRPAPAPAARASRWAGTSPRPRACRAAAASACAGSARPPWGGRALAPCPSARRDPPRGSGAPRRRQWSARMRASGPPPHTRPPRRGDHRHAASQGERTAGLLCPADEGAPLRAAQTKATLPSGQGLLTSCFSAHTEPNGE
jgi:hypothetical protein